MTIGRARVDAAARRVPAGDGGGRSKLGAAGAATMSATPRRVADLFCGLGPFALRLAERVRVSAFDADAGAIAALKQAAGHDAGPQAGRGRDARPVPAAAGCPELKRFDAVVFDPPRQGAEAQARELAKSAVPVVVAVSCNPATFARDARMLVDGGYRLTAVTPVDQFRHSAHVEIVARFER